MRNTEDAAHTIFEIYSRTAYSACVEVFSDFISAFGIRNFTILETDLGCRQRDVILAHSWDDRWRGFCRQAGHLHHDPLLAMIERDHGAFTLGERMNRNRPSADVGHLLQRFAAFGWQDALCVPIHRGGLRYGVASLISARRIATGDKAQLTAAAFAFHQRLRCLAPNEGFRTPPAGLGAEEIDCLRLLATGLSDAKTGEMLGLGGGAVHAHIESAKQKLAAQNRAELVSLAHSLAIIA
ncbi:helix-turn-helix transcriptional regulator [Rhizobium sp. G21]|uniref:helix-turn-helix transcriptional regulator n=1 Tax=Rhizobium sp. G21 TaxID=2758439 RepID=UPI001601BB85|nr:LuxR family transcriptional regulator [Rhizobium sp. G21]MBB1250610.1 autoinducer binding domain-containing protein [Rhizobium sp. G21]